MKKLSLLFIFFPLIANATEPINKFNLCSKTRQTMINLVDKEITDAAGAGNIDKIKAALKSGISPNSTDSEGFSLLHIALTRNQDELLDLLLKSGVDVNQPFMGSSPLSLELTSIGAGVDPEHKRSQKLTKAGASPSDFDIAFSAVLKLGYRSIADGFIDSITKGDIAKLELYARATYDINAPIVKGLPPLHIAAAQGKPESIKYLVKCGANVNGRAKSGAPVFWFSKNRPEISALLTELGATEKF